MQIIPHPTNPSIYSIKSTRDPRETYVIDYQKLTCTCRYFHLYCQKIPSDNPLRLCKHLIQVLLKVGIPPALEPVREEIEWAGKNEVRFPDKTDKWKKELNKNLKQTIFTVEDRTLKNPMVTVNTQARTCTCRFFARTLSKFPIMDPQRLCRHLVGIFVKIGIPEDLVPFKKDLEWCARHQMEYIPAASGPSPITPLEGERKPQTISISIDINTGEPRMKLTDKE